MVQYSILYNMRVAPPLSLLSLADICSRRTQCLMTSFYRLRMVNEGWVSVVVGQMGGGV